MLMEDLKACGFPDILIQSWKDSVGDTLLPLQEKAIREFDLLGQSNLIISAPTSSGKTFCGEIAMARALTAGRKAVYLVPLKALAEERYHDFQQKYARLGLKTIISTGDRRKHDFAFQRGDFDLAVVIFEKFSQLLTRNLDILSLIDLILIDELQMIGDSGRGSSLELLLLKIKVARYNCRLVGLSAVLSSSGDLANWLSARLLTSSYRPVDLYQGVLWQGRFDYRSYNSGQIGSEQVLDDDNLAPEDQLLRSVVNFIETGEKVLVFLKSRVSCQYFAESITDMVEPLRADDAIKALSSGDRTGLGDKLIELLEYGVAFHHADLSFEQRRILEHGFRAGKIRVIFATTTLAMGLNLPAGVVFLEPLKFAPGCYHKRLLAHHLNWSEYENMCGRAGRLRYTDRPGKALLLVNSEFEKEVIWNKFMLGKPSEFEGHLAQKSTADLVLDLVASGCCRTLDDVAGALQKSFSRAPFMDEDIKEASEFCYKRNFIVDREGACESTALGDTIAGYGISCATADQFLALLARSSDLNEACWLYELVTSGEMTDRARFSVHGRFEDVRLKQIQDGLKSHGLVEGFSLEQVYSRPELCDKNALSRIIICGALLRWCRGEALDDLEMRFRIMTGAILNVSETASWLAESLAAISRVIRGPRNLHRFFRRLAFALQNGLPYHLRPLFKIAGNILNRAELMLLYSRKIYNRSGLMTFPVAQLELMIGADKTSKLREKLNQNNKSNDSEEDNMNLRGDHELFFEAEYNRDRLTVRFARRRFPLTLKSFKYLAKLACARLTDKSGWLHKEDLEPGFNQARYIYNLKKELGLTRDRKVLENNRSGFYRLNLEPNQISFNFENLRRLPDFEIKELINQLETIKACA